MNRRTRIEHRDFICKGESHHRFRAAVRLRLSDDGEAVEQSAEFMVIGFPVWSPVPICQHPSICGAIAEESSTYDPRAAAVPASERMQVWLSPDGHRVAIPGRRNAPMPDRYAATGYRSLEAHSIRDIDRIEQIRSRQTGNQVMSEMQLDPAARRWNSEKPYDPDSMSEL